MEVLVVVRGISKIRWPIEIGLRILEMSEPKFTAASEEEEQMSSFALRPSDDGARVSLTGFGVKRFLGDGIILWRETPRRQGVPEKAPPQKTKFVPCVYYCKSLDMLKCFFSDAGYGTIHDHHNGIDVHRNAKKAAEIVGFAVWFASCIFPGEKILPCVDREFLAQWLESRGVDEYRALAALLRSHFDAYITVQIS